MAKANDGAAQPVMLLSAAKLRLLPHLAPAAAPAGSPQAPAPSVAPAASAGYDLTHCALTHLEPTSRAKIEAQFQQGGFSLGVTHLVHQQPNASSTQQRHERLGQRLTAVLLKEAPAAPVRHLPALFLVNRHQAQKCNQDSCVQIKIQAPRLTCNDADRLLLMKLQQLPRCSFIAPAQRTANDRSGVQLGAALRQRHHLWEVCGDHLARKRRRKVLHSFEHRD